MKNPTEYYSQQYNPRAMIPGHSRIFTRWVRESNHVRRTALLSPAWMPQAYHTPFLSAVGGCESDEFKRQNRLIGENWKASHVGDITLATDNHLTVCDAFATNGHPLFEAVVKLVAGLKTS